MSLGISIKSQIEKISHYAKTIRPTTPPTKPVEIDPEIVILSTSAASVPAALFLSTVKDYQPQNSMKASGHWETHQPMDSSDYSYQYWVEDPKPEEYIPGS